MREGLLASYRAYLTKEANQWRPTDWMQRTDLQPTTLSDGFKSLANLNDEITRR